MKMSHISEAPSSSALTLASAIDNVGHLSDVSDTDPDLLTKILPHCTVDQLMHIEKSTKGRDLSPITNSLWKKFYEKEFGTKEAELATINMEQKGRSYPWRVLYEAKLQLRVAAEEKSIQKLKAMYRKEEERKQSRRVQTCTKVPSARDTACGKRRFFFADGDEPVFNCKGHLMKKSKTQYLNSLEVKNRSFSLSQKGGCRRF